MLVNKIIIATLLNNIDSSHLIVMAFDNNKINIEYISIFLVYSSSGSSSSSSSSSILNFSVKPLQLR